MTTQDTTTNVIKVYDIFIFLLDPKTPSKKVHLVVGVHDVLFFTDKSLFYFQNNIGAFWGRYLLYLHNLDHPAFVLQLVVISQYHLGKILDLSGHMETSQLDDSEVSATQEVFTDDLATVYISNVSTSFAWP